jgi:hypothetical protein
VKELYEQHGWERDLLLCPPVSIYKNIMDLALTRRHYMVRCQGLALALACTRTIAATLHTSPRSTRPR